MKINRLEMKVGDLVAMRDEPGRLRFPKEYQRGQAWNKTQKQLFVDSLFRGYPLPVLYFHLRGTYMPAGKSEEHRQYDVIDGQQRIRALHEFSSDKFKLPSRSGYKFPAFHSETPNKWEENGFSDFSGELESLQSKFSEHLVIVYEIDTSDDNEVRDLFIRLQGGTPLTPQDKRDAWPGSFTKFILKIGGKRPNDYEDVGYAGHQFFETMVRGKEGGSAKRQLAAQIATLLLNRWDEDEGGKFRNFCAIDSRTLDESYRRNVGFDLNGENAHRVNRVLDKIVSAFGDARPKLSGHESIHLALLVDSLIDGYDSGWENGLYPSIQKFRNRVESARKGAEEFACYEKEYGQWTRKTTSDASSIERRHAFFSNKMREMLNPAATDRQVASVDLLMKEIVYSQDSRRCQWCEMKGKIHTVEWKEAQLHHVDPLTQGGKTEKSNLALVSEECRPSIDEDFRWWWHEKKSRGTLWPSKKRTPLPRELPPNGTKCRFRSHEGKIENRRLVVGNDQYKTFSEACEALTGKPMSGWNHWHVLTIDGWMLAGDWRQEKINRAAE